MLRRRVLVPALGLLTACAVPEQGAQSASNAVERGRHLVTTSGCEDCHSPKTYTDQGPVPDTTRRLSGHPASETLPPVPAGAPGQGWIAMTNAHFSAWAGPWGVSYAANLTPHETGIRSWTDSLFIVTMRTGKHLGVGRAILPPMPWPNYAQFTDEELRAIFAYLRSLPPVDNRVPAPSPPPGTPMPR